MNVAVDRVAVADTVEVDHLLQIHTALMEHSDRPEVGGVERTRQNWIGGNDFNPCYAAQGYSADRTKRGHGRAVAAGRQALPEVDRRVPVAHPPSLDRPRAARPWRAADLR